MSKITNMSVADLLGVSEATVSRLRAGSRRPSDRTLRRIADALGWPLREQLEELYKHERDEDCVAAWSAGFERVIREHFEAESATIPS